MSPNGRSIAYSSGTAGLPDARIAVQDRGCDQAQSHLFIRDPLGFWSRQLTTDPDGGRSQLPACSPDGRSLTFSRFDAAFADGDVWSLELASGVRTDLTPGPAFDFRSVWGPARADGRRP